jgi:hypothetical protein
LLDVLDFIIEQSSARDPTLTGHLLSMVAMIALPPLEVWMFWPF